VVLRRPVGNTRTRNLERLERGTVTARDYAAGASLAQLGSTHKLGHRNGPQPWFWQQVARCGRGGPPAPAGRTGGAGYTGTGPGTGETEGRAV